MPLMPLMPPAMPVVPAPVARHQRGFTLIELLVALAVMALLALLSWRGLDAMMQSHAQTRERSDAHLVLQTALAQWSTDLEALMPIAHTQTLDWDGHVLRLTRRASLWPDPGALVVAWARRESANGPYWLRWQSAPLQTLNEWHTAWSQAQQWAHNPNDTLRRNEIALLPLAQWRLLYYREGAWSHPQSSAGSSTSAESGTTGTPTATDTSAKRTGFNSASYTARLPEGIRLELVLPSGSGTFTGLLVRDWFNPLTTGL